MLCGKVYGICRPFNKGQYQTLILAHNGLWYLLILKSVVKINYSELALYWNYINKPPLYMRVSYIHNYYLYIQTTMSTPSLCFSTVR